MLIEEEGHDGVCHSLYKIERYDAEEHKRPDIVDGGKNRISHSYYRVKREIIEL